jgi:hypothetical protein
MILPDFILRSKQNKTQTEIWGYTHIEKKIILYPYHVTYNYNSRGFRDSEWPDSLEELKNAIWCFGDSFTFGTGSLVENTWPMILQSKTNQRCINVSLDGASNDWICRKVLRVLEVVQPKNIIIHWSFVHRSESADDSLDDEDRRIWARMGESESDFLFRFYNHITKIEAAKNNCVVTHSVIPEYMDDRNKKINEIIKTLWDKFKGSSWPIDPPDSISDVTRFIVNDQLNELYRCRDMLNKQNNLFDEIIFVPEFEKIDYACDNYHYDKLTATEFVNKLVKLIRHPL